MLNPGYFPSSDTKTKVPATVGESLFIDVGYEVRLLILVLPFNFR
jgi:hypothetical protein